MPKPRNKNQEFKDAYDPAVNPPEEELGLMFVLAGGKLRQVDTIPLTYDDADGFVISSQMMSRFVPNSQDPPTSYFVPLSAFKPITRTNAEELSVHLVRGADSSEEEECNCLLCQLRRGMDQ